MRVAMLGWELPPRRSGGLGTHCYELIKRLVKKGVVVDFYMPKVDYRVEESGANLIFVDYAAVKPYGSETQNYFENVAAYNRKCVESVIERNSKAQYNLIHCHDWLTALAGVELKRKLKKQFVLTIHSTEYDRTANLFPWDKIVEIERLGVGNADRIITVSKRTKAQLVDKYNANPAKIKVIYNAIDATRFRRAKAEKGLERIVMYFGRLTVQKGPDFFLRAAKKVLALESNVRFVVAGGGEMLRQLVELTVQLGIYDKVTFTGYVADENIPELYALADVFVLPSVSEPFGIAALEAMASGVPIIISKTSGVSELVRSCLLVDFWDVDEMANKIIAVLRYDALSRTLREEELREITERRFSWENAAEETIKLYHELK
ncbi:MAG: glycosyltransferase family 4 protein [Candidatus Thermoplasmatota archaeon]|nr:glycosyltransferase family 4 protein [Candidatus Thermoplasmatota archaeon]